MTDEQEVEALERQWITAFGQSHIGTLNRILADGFVFTDPNGILKSKEQWLSELSSGALSVESLYIEYLSVKVSGDVATVDVYLALKAKSIEGGYDGHYHSVDMFEKREGRWQVTISGAKSVGVQQIN